MPGEPSLTTRLGGYLDEMALLPLIVDMDNAKKSVVIGARVLKNKEVRTGHHVIASRAVRWQQAETTLRHVNDTLDMQVADAMIRAKAKFDRQATFFSTPSQRTRRARRLSVSWLRVSSSSPCQWSS